MKKIIIPIFIILLYITLVQAIEICDDEILPLTPCQMNTPVVDCVSLDYQLIDQNGSIIENGTLLNLTDSLYYFVFNQSAGGYVVKLCDNTTREINVTPEADNTMIVIVLALIAIPFVLLYVASQLKEEDLPLNRAFKLLTYIISVTFTAALANIGLKMAANTLLENTTVGIFKVVMYFIYAFNGLIFLVLFIITLKLFGAFIPTISKVFRK